MVAFFSHIVNSVHERLDFFILDVCLGSSCLSLAEVELVNFKDEVTHSCVERPVSDDREVRSHVPLRVDLVGNAFLDTSIVVKVFEKKDSPVLSRLEVEV